MEEEGGAEWSWVKPVVETLVRDVNLGMAGAVQLWAGDRDVIERMAVEIFMLVLLIRCCVLRRWSCRRAAVNMRRSREDGR